MNILKIIIPGRQVRTTAQRLTQLKPFSFLLRGRYMSATKSIQNGLAKTD